MNTTLTELEEAINYWRVLRPSTGDAYALSAEVNVLANVYAMLIISGEKNFTHDAIEPAACDLLAAWRERSI
jgi:hypothetical protein